GSAIGLAGDDLVLAYARLAEGKGTVELRNDQLQILESVPVDDVSFLATRQAESAIDLYLGAHSRIHAEAGMLSQESVDPEWEVIGGLEGYLVEIDTEVRMTHGDTTWSAPWPHTQISPPAVVRRDGPRAAFSLETELTAVVGYPTATELN